MKKKRILLWGALPEVPKNEPFELSFRRSGNNFGNMLIGNGVVSVLTDCEYVAMSQLSGPEEANEKCDHIVIPAANFLWKGFDFGYMADFIEATNLPVTIVGLGAQSHDRSMVSEVHPNTLRLVKIISERSPSLGVRGFYTAEVLAANGILNVEVLGCPSLYTKGTPPSQIKSNKNVLVSDLVVNFSRRVSSHSFEPTTLRMIENALLKLAVKNNLPFIAQDELEELAISNKTAEPDAAKMVAKYFDEFVDKAVLDYFKSNTHYFCNVSDWSSFMAIRSGCIGSRLHGNIVAMINGVPGLTIAHDSRTLEMCALTGAPYMHVKELAINDLSPDFLVERFIEADFGLFVSNMNILFRRYKDFLGDHSLANIL